MEDEFGDGDFVSSVNEATFEVKGKGTFALRMSNG
jgi:hypothetical protein